MQMGPTDRATCRGAHKPLRRGKGANAHKCAGRLGCKRWVERYDEMKVQRPAGTPQHKRMREAEAAWGRGVSPTSSATPFHSASILSMACSMANSLPATSHTLVTSSILSSSLSALSLVSVKDSSQACVMSSPTTAVSCSQCRIRIPGLRSAVTSGITGINSSSSLFTCFEMSHSPGVFSNVLTSLYMVREACCRSLSIFSGSRAIKAPLCHSCCHCTHFAPV
eukprot:3572166-Pleurochrysis_carterae.AAC.1